MPEEWGCHTKKSVHSLSAQRVWISVCAESLGDRFAIFVAYFCAPKNNCQLFPLFAAALSVCECVSLCVCLLVNYNWWFSFSSQLAPPYRTPSTSAFFSSYSAHFLSLSLFPCLCPPCSRYLFDCCHVRLFRCRCRCCCCSSAFFISCTESWSKEGIIKLQLDNIRDCRDCRYITACT